MIVTRSTSDFASTVARLDEAITRRGLTVFARFDHAGAARAAGLALDDELVVVFGNPRAGTPLMQLDPRIGLELPLRMLVWTAADGASLGYIDPRDLASRFEVREESAILDQMAVLLNDIAAQAAGA